MPRADEGTRHLGSAVALRGRHAIEQVEAASSRAMPVSEVGS